jgi:hypothetical protein
VADQEALHAGELVVLLGEHADGQFLVRQIGSRELESLRCDGLVLVHIHAAGHLLVALRLQLLDRVAADFLILLLGRIVVGCHQA